MRACLFILTTPFVCSVNLIKELGERGYKSTGTMSDTRRSKRSGVNVSDMKKLERVMCKAYD